MPNQSHLIMPSINAYLNFPGNTEEVFQFYKTVFGGEFAMLQKFKDMPGQEIPAEAHDKIMHIALPIGKDDVLMGSDAIPGMGPPYKAGTNVSLSISSDTEAEARRLFQALSAGGQVTLPFEKQFWGDFFGMLTDKYGTQWMVSYSETRR